MSSRGRLTALTLAFAILGLALLAGCGGGGPRDPSADEQAAIEARLDDYTQGFADGDPKAICATFVPEEIGARRPGRLHQGLRVDREGARRQRGRDHQRRHRPHRRR